MWLEPGSINVQNDTRICEFLFFSSGLEQIGVPLAREKVALIQVTTSRLAE